MKRSPPKMKRIAALLNDLIQTMEQEGYPKEKIFEAANFASGLEKLAK
jgi:hypothetical protein